MQNNTKSINWIPVLKMDVHLISYEIAVKKIMKQCENHDGSYVCVANVHMCMETFDNPDFCNIVNAADLVVPDGKPLVWAQKLLGEKSASQVRGSDLLLTVCKAAEKAGIPIGFYGGTEKSLSSFMIFLKKKYPNLDIPYAYSPPFRELTEKEDDDCVKEISTSKIKILFVGIGCPKQEKWMAQHKDRLHCVMIGVGAAFDFFSGEKKHAPLWMQKTGTEWVFRFANDPKRLWKRYVKHNPRFVYYFLKQLFSK